MKKIISATLASILAVSALSTFAFAEDATTVADSYPVEAVGTLAKPPIKVTMPKSFAFVFNPYGLKIDEKGKISADGLDDIVVAAWSDKTAKTWEIVNATGANLQAAVYAYSENAGDATFLVSDKTVTALAANSGKKALKLEITATGAAATTVKLANAALTTNIWTEANKTSGATAFLVPKITDKLKVAMAGTVENPDKLQWTTEDAPKVNFIFAFDFSADQTA
jgi:hypothetical protein